MKPCMECRTKNPDSANFCYNCGRPFAANVDELKIITVLFADLKGFTDLSAHLAPDELKEVIDACFRTLSQAVEEEGGRVLKHEGDCIMAAFGLSGGADMAPSLACYAGLKMQGRMAAFEHPLLKRVQRSLSLRIGIHTGQVVIGEIGYSTDILGETVNIAKRMEQNAPSGGILISSETAAHTHMRFQLSREQPLLIKGRDDAIKASLVLGKHSRQRRSILGKASPTVGRSQEFEKIREVYESCEYSYVPHLHLLEGEAGVGKSRLIQDFSDWLKASSREVYLCHSTFNSTVSHDYRILKVFLYRMGLESLQGLKECMSSDLEDYTIDEIERMARAISGLVGFSGGARMEGGNAQVSLAFSAMRLWLSEVSRFRPVVFFVDDMHWADEGSLRLLDSLLSTIRGRFFVLCAGRPIRKAQDFLFSTRNCSRQEVQPLSTASTRRVALEFLRQVENLPRSVTEDIVDAAQGNPLFLEELILQLENQGILQSEDSGIVFHPTDRLQKALPTSIELAIQERLDLLPSEDRRVLQAASVFGRQFEWVGAAHLAGVEVKPPLIRRCRSQALVIPEKPTQENAFPWRFQSELIRDSLYQRLTSRHRQKLHQMAADWLMQNRYDSCGPSVLAQHYRQASNYSRAWEYLLKTADHSFQSWQLHRALREYKDILKGYEASQLVLEDERLALILERVSLLFRMLGQDTEGFEFLSPWFEREVSDEAGLRIGLLKFRYAALLGLEEAQTHYDMLLERFVELCENQSSCAELWTELQLAAAMAFRLLKSSRSVHYLQEALRYVSDLDDAHLHMSLEVELGISLTEDQDPREGLKRFESALQTATTLKDLRTMARCQHNLGICYRIMGQYTEARRSLEDSIRIKEKIGDIAGCLMCLQQLAIVCMESGGCEEAELYAKRSLKQARLVRQRLAAARSQALLAQICAKKAEASKSLKHAWYALDELVQQKTSRALCLEVLLPVVRALGRVSEKEAQSLIQFMIGQIEGLQDDPAWDELQAFVCS